MALYAISDDLAREAVSGLQFIKCDYDITPLHDPLTPGAAIVAALFPALDADVRDALGELVGASRDADAFIGTANGLLHINKRYDSVEIMYLFDSRQKWPVFYVDGGLVTGRKNSDEPGLLLPPLLPAIKAATARMKG